LPQPTSSKDCPSTNSESDLGITARFKKAALKRLLRGMSGPNQELKGRKETLASFKRVIDKFFALAL
jgi:hypothetical protein